MPTPEEKEAARSFVRLPLQGKAARRTGADFVREVQGFVPPPGVLAVWYLSQESVIWKAGGATIWIDPFLAEMKSRRYPPLCAPEDVADAADVVLITHEHLDHLHQPSCAGIAQASPKAVFVAPPICGPMLREAGIPAERIRTPRTGEPLEFGRWRVTSVPGAHDTVDWTPERGHRWVGYIGEVDGGVYYHAGDTIVCDELLAALLPWVGKLDLAMVPINGRDYFRTANDIIGNFTFREAAEVAMRLNPGLTVPMHYDLFWQNNEERVAHFVDYIFDKAPYLPIAVMAPGQRMLVGG